MTQSGPIHLLPFDSTDYQRKRGGGGGSAPIVPVTATLRSELSAEIDSVVEYAEAAHLRNDLPVPVVARMRPKALAKSSRPYDFLKEMSVPVEAALGAGELVIKGTPEGLRSLKSAVLHRNRKSDLFDISTFESFAAWIPEDITLGQAWNSVSGTKLITVTLFPWLELDSRYADGQTIGGFIESLGLEIQYSLKTNSQVTIYLAAPPISQPNRLVELQGIRRVGLTQEYKIPSGVVAQSFALVGGVRTALASRPAADQPQVGVFDSGMQSVTLAPWIVASEAYDTGADLDPDHGTFVGGLIAAARELNGGDVRFPDESAAVVDAQVLPAGNVSEGLLLTRIEEVLDKYSSQNGPHVWNCSFANHFELSPVTYSDFAQQLDELASKHGVLLVQAAGNYSDPPFRNWPTLPGMPYTDRLASPAEALRSLTVGAISHKGGYVPSGSPASYSRRGPGFSYMAKPDVCHYAGDLSSARTLARFGIESIISNDREAESVGTSFAAPLVSTIAANTWSKLEQSGSTSQVRPELVKGLIVHAAALKSGKVPAEERNFRGWGIPPESDEILNNRADEFTTVHEVVLTPGNDWIMTPFPVPECLLVGGKFKGEIVLTISYDPPINISFGVEAARHDVEGSFGRVSVGARGLLNVDGIVPHDKSQSAHAWESRRIEEGKWTPIKTYRKTYSQGTHAGDWGLRLVLTERVTGEQGKEQLAFAIITFRSIDPGLPVYSDGVALLSSMRLNSKTMLQTSRLRLEP